MKYFFFTFFSLVMLSFDAESFVFEKPIVVVLHGGSSAGKSSICASLRSDFPELHFQRVGVDSAIDLGGGNPLVGRVSGNHNESSVVRDWFHSVSTEASCDFVAGKKAQVVWSGFADLAKTFYQNGINVVVDEVFTDPTVLQHYFTALRDCKVYFVKVFCDSNILRDRALRRSQEKGDNFRPKELGLSQLDLINDSRFVYDLELDTSCQDPGSVTKKLLDFIKNNPSPSGWQKSFDNWFSRQFSSIRKDSGSIVSVGKLKVFSGPMFCGKSDELVRVLKRRSLMQQKTKVFLHSVSRMASDNVVLSRTGAVLPAVVIENANDIFDNLDNAKVVGIDEAHFFDDSLISVINELIKQGVDVYVAGLDLDFKGDPFGCVPKLMATADKTIKFKAICDICLSSACRSQRLIDGKPVVKDGPVVGIESDRISYRPRCKNCFYKNV